MKSTQEYSIYIFGMSHTAALKQANIKYKIVSNHLILNLHLKQNFIDLIGSFNEDYKKGFVDEKLKNNLNLQGDFISMIGGNMHNLFGLIEHPIKYDFVTENNKLETDSSRHIIPYSVLYDFFEKRILVQIINVMKGYGEVFNGRKYHICSPPPIFSEDYLKTFPGVFKDKLHFGVSKPQFRKKLYDLHSKIIKKHCENIGFVFIPPPIESMDENGFLKPEYTNNDPTHGNIEYGKLVLQQLKLQLDEN